MRYSRALLIDPDTDGGVPVDAAIDGNGDKVKIACGGRRGFVIQVKVADLLAEITGINIATSAPLYSYSDDEAGNRAGDTSEHRDNGPISMAKDQNRKPGSVAERQDDGETKQR